MTSAIQIIQGLSQQVLGRNVKESEVIEDDHLAKTKKGTILFDKDKMEVVVRRWNKIWRDGKYDFQPLIEAWKVLSIPGGVTLQPIR